MVGILNIRVNVKGAIILLFLIQCKGNKNKPGKGTSNKSFETLLQVNSKVRLKHLLINVHFRHEGL